MSWALPKFPCGTYWRKKSNRAAVEKRRLSKKKIRVCRDNDRKTEDEFLNRIIVSDEAHFHLHGFVNKQTFRLGSSNPELTFETPLHPERITVCVVCFHKRIMNLFFKQTVCDANYREILTIFFPQVPHEEFWFQQHRATAHTVRKSMTLLRAKFRLISGFGAVHWLARLQDLTTLDFWLWGYLKDRAYSNEFRNIALLIWKEHWKRKRSSHTKDITFCHFNALGSHV